MPRAVAIRQVSGRIIKAGVTVIAGLASIRIDVAAVNGRGREVEGLISGNIKQLA